MMGPLAEQESWAHYRSDSAFHATYWIAAWPRSEVGPAFLAPLLMQTQALRAVAVTIEPIPYSVAMRRAEAAQTAEVAEEIDRERQGFITTAPHNAAAPRPPRAARRSWPTATPRCASPGSSRISERGERELERSESEVEHAAALARLELQPPLRRAGRRLRLHPAALPGPAVRRRRAQRPGHSATTAHFQAAYPFLARAACAPPASTSAATPTAAPGSMTRGRFTRSSWRARTCWSWAGSATPSRALSRPTSTASASSRRQAWVLDPKGEYGPLARALGVEPISLAPGGEVRLNPISPRGGREGQLSLLRSVAQAALRRELGPEEDAGLRVALDQVSRECGEREPTLPMVVEALLHPREAMVRGVSAAGEDEFAAASRSSALALQRLCDGDLRGMFDGPTTAGLDLDGPLVVLDLSAVRDSAALGILMTCAGAWQQAILAERKRAAEQEGASGAKLISVVEEGWRVTSHIGVAEWLQENFKLCRALGDPEHPRRPPAQRLRRLRGGGQPRGADRRGAVRRRRHQGDLRAVARPGRRCCAPSSG